MATTFGTFDLTNCVERDGDWAVPYWEPNDPIIRTPLAYGGESIQDSGYRVMTMTLDLLMENIIRHKQLRAISGTTAALIYNDLYFTGVTLVVRGPARWFADGTVSCQVELTCNWWSTA